MVTSSCVVNCTNRHTKDSKLPFYRIPSNKTPIGARQRREGWKLSTEVIVTPGLKREYQKSEYVVATSSQVDDSFNSVLKKVNWVFETS